MNQGNVDSLQTGQTRAPERAWADFVDKNWKALQKCDAEPEWERLAGDGSDRSFARIVCGSETAVLVHGPDPAENLSYEMIGRHIWKLNGSCPEFMAVDRAAGLFLIEDLGSVALYDYVAGTDEIMLQAVYEKILGLLAEIHKNGLNGFDPEWCYQTPRYDRRLILRRETGYFLSAFVINYMELTADTEKLGSEFSALADAALEGSGTVLMHRDFQSRNIMIKNGRPRLIDFQGARPGPAGYDLASLLFDPYIGLEAEMRERLFEFYIQRRTGGGGFEEKSFRRTYPFLAVCRLLQALGAFGFLTLEKGKTFFKEHIPAAAGSLHEILLHEEFDFFSELRYLISEIILRLEKKD